MARRPPLPVLTPTAGRATLAFLPAPLLPEGCPVHRGRAAEDAPRTAAQSRALRTAGSLTPTSSPSSSSLCRQWRLAHGSCAPPYWLL